ncbi:MAG: GNAT family N-acetyltransferase [Pseudomonadota bacterium]
MRKSVLKTSRLTLRRWNLDSDVDPYTDICADPEVMRWIGDGTTRSRSECAASIAAFEAAWDQLGFGLFALEEHDSGALIGFAGLAVPTFLPAVMPAVEIGWRLKRSHWGQGYATEAARRVLEFGFDRCRLDEIISIHQVGNDASARIMQKLGLQFRTALVDPTCDRPVHIYAASRR